MGIFFRRPLCLFCCLFLLGALGAWFLPGSAVVWCMIGLALIWIALFTLRFLLKEHKIRILTLMLCVGSILLAVLHSFLTVDLPQKRANTYVGERQVLAYVRECTDRSDYTERYRVTLRNIDGEAVRIDAELVCGFEAELSGGDYVMAQASVWSGSAEDSDRNGDGYLLIVSLSDATKAYAQRTSQSKSVWELLFSDSGLGILATHARSDLQDKLADLLGEEIGALAGAFLFGDSSALSTELVRDFRRSGTSHMMAVSGLHISVLLGSIELLLRKLFVPKRARCAVVALCGLIFLFLTGFSASACRSVLMLFAVYINYLLYEENDSLTSLFVSISLILLLSPYAVADLGLWMSFLATLGLLTVYPLCEKHLPSPKKEKGLLARLWRLSRRIFLIVLMTVIANLFLLPIIWIFFGELSLVALLSNPVLSPISSLFLIGVPCLLVLSFVPFLRELLVFAVGALGQGTVWLVQAFSRFPNATVSLRYGFCSVIIPIFTVSMTVLLVVRLRKKRWLALPPTLAILSFVLCFAVYHGTHREPMLTYRVDEWRNECFTVSEGNTLSICDLSGGSWSAYANLMAEVKNSTATEIHMLMLTHYHDGHVGTLDLLLRQTVVRTLLLPMPTDATETACARKLYAMAEGLETEVIFYDGENPIAFSQSVWVQPEIRKNGEEHVALSLSFVGFHEMVTYLSPTATLSSERLGNSRMIFFGSHGDIFEDAERLTLPADARTETVIYASDLLPRRMDASSESLDVYVAQDRDRTYRYSFILP